jgi:hypothetical protein
MVPSSTVTIVVDGERLTCGGFSLGKPVRHRNFEFIGDYFGGPSLSPRGGGNSSTAFMGSTHHGASTLWWAKIEDSAEEFIITMQQMESTPAVKAMTMIPPWMAVMRAEVGLPFE